MMYLLAKKLGFADQMFKNIKVENNVPVAEDILREINRGGWSTGYCGQSPERLKSHMANQKDFDMLTQKATTGPNKGDYYGLPWPCWGTPEFKHPGTPLLYNTNLSIKEGGGTFRAALRRGARGERCRTARKRKVSLLGNGYYSKDSEIKDGYPEFTLGVLQEARLGQGPDRGRAGDDQARSARPTPDAVSWAIDLSGGIQRVAIEHGCIPYGNGKARANAFGLPDAIPVHREPIYTPRPELVAKYPTLPNARAVPHAEHRLRRAEGGGGQGHRQAVPAHPHLRPSGRIRRRRRGDALQQVARRAAAGHVHRDQSGGRAPSAASRTAAGSGSPAPRSTRKARMKALVTERVGKGVTWCPFHFAGWFQGVDQRGNYPKGTDPIVLGESVNTLTTYGFDPVTGMQEPKATLCQVRAA